MHVVEAIAVTFDVEVDGEARVVAGGHVGVVDADGVLDHAKQRTAERRIQRVAHREEQRAQMPAGVRRRELLGQIARGHRDEIGRLLTVDVDDRKTLACLHFERASMSCFYEQRPGLACHHAHVTAPG